MAESYLQDFATMDLEPLPLPDDAGHAILYPASRSNKKSRRKATRVSDGEGGDAKMTTGRKADGLFGYADKSEAAQIETRLLEQHQLEMEELRAEWQHRLSKEQNNSRKLRMKVADLTSQLEDVHKGMSSKEREHRDDIRLAREYETGMTEADHARRILGLGQTEVTAKDGNALIHTPVATPDNNSNAALKTEGVNDGSTNDLLLGQEGTPEASPSSKSNKWGGLRRQVFGAKLAAPAIAEADELRKRVKVLTHMRDNYELRFKAFGSLETHAQRLLEERQKLDLDKKQFTAAKHQLMTSMMEDAEKGYNSKLSKIQNQLFQRDNLLREMDESTGMARAFAATQQDLDPEAADVEQIASTPIFARLQQSEKAHDKLKEAFANSEQRCKGVEQLLERTTNHLLTSRKREEELTECVREARGALLQQRALLEPLMQAPNNLGHICENLSAVMQEGGGGAKFKKSGFKVDIFQGGSPDMRSPMTPGARGRSASVYAGMPRTPGTPGQRKGGHF